MRWAVMLALVVSLAGCNGPPRIDATNDETLKASMEAVTAGMSKAEKDVFAGDCSAVILSEGLPRAFRGAPAPSSTAETAHPLHGLTAAEVHAKAAPIIAKMSAPTGAR